MQPNKYIKKKLSKFSRKQLFFGGAIFLALLGFVIFSDYGLITRISLEMQKRAMKSKLIEIKHIQDSLKANAKHLENDDAEIERIAREKYGMIKPGERIYYIETEK